MDLDDHSEQQTPSSFYIYEMKGKSKGNMLYRGKENKLVSQSRKMGH